MFGAHRGVMPIVARLAGPDAIAASLTATDAPLAGASSPGALLPSGDPTGLGPVQAPHRRLALDALMVTRTLRDHPRDADPWGEPAFAREVDLIRSQLAPIRSRRGLAASFEREAFQSREFDGSARAGDVQGTARRLRLALAGARRRCPAAGMDRSRHRPRLTRPRSPSPLSFADAPVTPLLHHAPRRPRRCRDAVASTARSRRLRPPARLRDLLAAAARQAGQRPGRAGHPRGAERDRRPGDRDAGRPSRPTSGGRAAATTRSGPS